MHSVRKEKVRFVLQWKEMVTEKKWLLIFQPEQSISAELLASLNYTQGENYSVLEIYNRSTD